MIDKFFAEACDVMDSGVYTGDALHDEDTRKEFRTYLNRWERGLKEWEDQALQQLSESGTIKELIHCFDVVEFKHLGAIVQGYVVNIIGSCGYCEVSCKRRVDSTISTNISVQFEDMIKIVERTDGHNMTAVFEKLEPYEVKI